MLCVLVNSLPFFSVFCFQTELTRSTPCNTPAFLVIDLLDSVSSFFVSTKHTQLLACIVSFSFSLPGLSLSLSVFSIKGTAHL